MAARSISTQKVFYGPLNINITDGEAVPSDLLDLDLPSHVAAVLNITKKVETVELVNKKKLEFVKATKLEFSLPINEIDATDIGNIDDGVDLILTTSKGGTNGTGHLLTIADCQQIWADIEANKTVIKATKTIEGDTLASLFTLASNAA